MPPVKTRQSSPASVFAIAAPSLATRNVNSSIASAASGSSLKAIGRAFGKPSSSIYFLVAPHGGIRPAQRRRSRLALTLAEREVISRGITAHQSTRSIAKVLGRSPSTVSREMSRNGGYDRYRAALADESAWARARRPKCCKLANSRRLRQAVAGKLRSTSPRATSTP
jgi:DNA-binding CsgD family transcriptional regulator